jgi:hypothetical protein
MSPQVSRLGRRLAFIAALVAIPVPAFSQFSSGPPGFAKEGGYVGFSVLPNFTFDGVTFDGESWYKEIGGDEVVILPKLSTQNMVRVILGYRAKNMGIEVSYDRTSHNGTYLGGSGTALFQSVNVDGRYYFLSNSRIQPYAQVGGSMPWFKVKEGAFNEETFGDASFNGYGVSTEAGVVVYPHRKLGISVGYNYRVISFDKVHGINDTLYELRPRFRETSGTVVVGAHMIF